MMRVDDRWYRQLLNGLVAVAASVCLGCGGSGGDAAGDGGAGSGSTAAGTSDTSNACGMLTAEGNAAAVGNPVEAGRPFAGPEVCKWDTADPDLVSVLLTVRLAAGSRAPVLCEEVRKAGGAPIDGVGEAATWEFSSAGSLFNSGDLEVCQGGHFVGLSLNGQRDEAALKAAALSLARTVIGRL
jgi:hypothetical protein